jgi:vitamin-K-epoxide reductase (warfarin-sensitive)
MSIAMSNVGKSNVGTPNVVMTNAVRWVFAAIALLALAGIAVSSVSLFHHYGTSKTTYCDFGESFNCDIVNRSIYSTVLGVPDALIGIFGYAGLLALASLYRAKAEAPAMLLIASVAGLSFAVYLTYIEAFVLATWCILCLSSLTLIVLITGLSSFLVASAMRRS